MHQHAHWMQWDTRIQNEKWSEKLHVDGLCNTNLCIDSLFASLVTSATLRKSSLQFISSPQHLPFHISLQHPDCQIFQKQECYVLFDLVSFAARKRSVSLQCSCRTIVEFSFLQIFCNSPTMLKCSVHNFKQLSSSFIFNRHPNCHHISMVLPTQASRAVTVFSQLWLSSSFFDASHDVFLTNFVKIHWSAGTQVFEQFLGK